MMKTAMIVVKISRYLKINKQKIIIIIFLCSGNIFCYSQTTISGSIKDVHQNPIPFTNVLLKKDSLSSIIDYTYSDDNGIYNLKIKSKGNYNLSFSSLGYETKILKINIKKSNSNILKNIFLIEKPFSLDEIIIQSEKTIKVKKDTIEVKVSRFLTGNDATVEDLLKKIPGVTVNSEGTIKVGKVEIEKLMIDGDDFFERGYKILSKNMPPNQIEKIQILQKYSNNKLLKGIEESEKVALNLVLKEDAKRQWFGNTSLSYDLTSTNKYHLKTYLMNFGKKNKYIFLSNFNSIGYNATGDINHLIRPFRFNEPASIGDNQQLNNVLNLSSIVPNFKRSRTNFNNSELVSLNAIFNPTKKIKIKTLGFFNWDETDFFRNSIAMVNVNETSFTNTEDYQLRNKKQVAFTKLDVTYNISKTKVIEATTKYNNGNFNDTSSLVFNGNSTIENLKHQNTLFDQKLNFTNKFNDRKVLLLTGRFIDEKAPQTYSFNDFIYQELFPTISNVNSVKQQNTNKMQFVGFNAHLLGRERNDNLLELQLGNEFRRDKLTTTFSLLENETVLEAPIGYQNQTNYQANNLYFKSKYLLKFKDFSFVGNLNFHQLFNRLKNNANFQNESPFFINPSVSFDWEINNKNKITASYSYNTTNAKVLDVFSDFILTGFRSFSKGTNSFNQLDASSITLNYELGNWDDRFFANTFIMYNKNHDFFSSNSTLNQNFTQAEKILIKDREFISINSKLDYYFKFISSNLKLDLGYSKSNFKNIINDSNLREITSNNYNYGLEFRSGFKGVFNYHMGTKWNATEIKTTINNSFTNNVSFLDLSFAVNKKLDFQFQSESYYFGNLETDNTYYFLDFDARYKLIKNKLTLAITGKNLFNTEKFRNFSISDIGTSTTEYRLLPRFVLLKLEYRF